MRGIRSKSAVPVEPMSRRSMPGLTAKGAVTVVVPQSVLSCATGDAAGALEVAETNGDSWFAGGDSAACPPIWRPSKTGGRAPDASSQRQLRIAERNGKRERPRACAEHSPRWRTALVAKSGEERILAHGTARPYREQ
jgi:hypothetical protein